MTMSKKAYYVLLAYNKTLPRVWGLYSSMWLVNEGIKQIVEFNKSKGIFEGLRYEVVEKELTEE